jgi:tRNA pseudouridine55 synthase
MRGTLAETAVDYKEEGIRPPQAGPGEGIWVLAKPQGPTSNQVLQRLKKAVGRLKMGYLGTLDPLATGVLPICIGWATKLISFIPDSPKGYRAEMTLGLITDTQDITGQVLSRSDRPVPERAALEEACLFFCGPRLQTPPVYSALKHRGQPLYRWARQGKPVVKPPRPVAIESIRITEVRGETVSLTVTCSPGTYIRTLCADIGERLGCGATLSALERFRSGPFTLERALAPDALQAAVFRGEAEVWQVPLADVLGGLPQVCLPESWRKKIREGRRFPAGEFRLDDSSDKPGPVCILSERKELWAIYQAAEDGTGEWAPRRVLI